ncbi:CAP domain-containing protein [Streptomyces malaysiensis subsp. malaysiensis]|uniref:TerD family protein n=1 Tax=Streptomyces malaysiensis TaxID=92644 RepID=A0ABX6WG39_STRMQ|nr:MULTISPECIES: CAP domain-containing protein [Streptomyces]QPI60385.1 TerD family protein [Streptomyces solisilvae]UHH22093.1 CAP domain-containing protein [Streptomyces sp. HNM0561]
MGELVPGGNQALPDGALTIRVPGPFDLSALITGEDGKVAGDGDFVFFNQPTAPGARLDGDTVTLRPRGLRPGAARVTLVISPADPGTPLGRLPAPVLSVLDDRGAPLARFAPPRPSQETVLLLAEIYRRGGGWKVRAIGQGYADGLAGVARDFGVDVTDDGASAAPPPPAPAPADGAARQALEVVNAARARAGAAPVALDGRLTAAAEAHARAMAAHGALALESPDGTSLFHRIAAHGYTPLTVAEHIVSGPRTPREFVDYCLEGAERRGPFHDPALVHLGIGRADGPTTGDVYWTAVWARPFTPDGLLRLTSEVIALTNAERAAARLAPLAQDPRLAAAAQAHSDDMVARDFYSHTGPEGHQPWDRARAAGATHRGIGENIACGQRSPAEVVRGWMDSPGHRANVLKPDFTHIGVGHATGSRAGTYWTQVFGAV